MDKKFIRTLDATTAQQLINLGYTLISHGDKEFVFINSPEKYSNDINRKKIVFTDILYL